MERFTIQIPDAILDDLRERLRRTRFPPAIPATGWSQGVDADWLREAVRHWAERYDWRTAEREMNRWTHLRTEISGNPIHFIHAPSPKADAVPLIVTHGWPGSFLEMMRVLPLLVDAGFQVVVPSLPGFGFSAPLRRTGVSLWSIADLWAELMTRLGHGRFIAQGGDLGAGVSTCLGLRHPDRLIGLHLNYIPGSYRPDPAGPEPTAEEQAFLASAEAWYSADGGYWHEQATRPATIGAALDDSPAGLLAWIGEKLREWSDCGGDLERRFSLDEVLTHVTLYWITQTATSSSRLYYETRLHPVRFAAGDRVRVPTAVARFPLEAPFPPRSWIERGYDVHRFTEMPRGGHFAAWEEPELLAGDLRAFLGQLTT